MTFVLSREVTRVYDSNVLGAVSGTIVDNNRYYVIRDGTITIHVHRNTN